MRTIIIGDIHGCLKELKELLVISDYQEYDRLILLGDYINQGPSSKEVIDYLKELKSNNENVILLRGNHDYRFINDDRMILDNVAWILKGKYKTLKEFQKHEVKEYKKWLKNNTVRYYEDKQFQCAHASIKKENIKYNSDYILMYDHFYCRSNDYNGKLTIVGHSKLKQPRYYPGKGGKIEFPHYFQEYDLPKCGIMLIDTGCVYGNRLTSMIIDNNKYILKYVDRRK